ncbi:transposase [Streptomyces sp. NBC_01622]|uniref:transposase n=1 Tax=Streptomyces sp. NBC_01622 TaxID=2975903 RepID=UPI0038675D8E|nr:transposase [Streptomyces sp. NBC_01622]
MWERMLTTLCERERVQLGRDPTPGAAIVDSQSVRAGERGGLHGYDGGKEVSGIKRHLLVDTCGTVLAVCVIWHWRARLATMYLKDDCTGPGSRPRRKR